MGFKPLCFKYAGLSFCNQKTQGIVKTDATPVWHFAQIGLYHTKSR